MFAKSNIIITFAPHFLNALFINNLNEYESIRNRFHFDSRFV